MSQLRSVIEEMTGFDPNDLRPNQLAAVIIEAIHCQLQLDATVARWKKSLEDREGLRSVGGGLSSE